MVAARPVDPPHGCRRCPRLASFLADNRRKEPNWHNGPVPTWFPPGGTDDVLLLIVGLAPGLRGANRTARAFTGDASGEVLIPMLIRLGLAQGNWGNHAGDGVALVGTAITNAVRCVPPQNRPTGPEISTCRDRFLAPTLKRLPNLKTIITLGRIAHDSTVRALGAPLPDHPFGHNVRSSITPKTGRTVALRASFHCSRYNMNTGRLTSGMFEQVFDGL